MRASLNILVDRRPDTFGGDQLDGGLRTQDYRQRRKLRRRKASGTKGRKSIVDISHQAERKQ